MRKVNIRASEESDPPIKKFPKGLLAARKEIFKYHTSYSIGSVELISGQ